MSSLWRYKAAPGLHKAAATTIRDIVFSATYQNSTLYRETVEWHKLPRGQASIRFRRQPCLTYINREIRLWLLININTYLSSACGTRVARDQLCWMIVYREVNAIDIFFVQTSAVVDTLWAHWRVRFVHFLSGESGRVRRQPAWTIMYMTQIRSCIGFW